MIREFTSLLEACVSCIVDLTLMDVKITINSTYSLPLLDKPPESEYVEQMLFNGLTFHNFFNVKSNN